MIDDYIVMQYGQIWEVKCKGCGTTIKKMVPHDAFSVSEKVNGRTIVRERLILAPLPSYREVLMEFDDGSKHVTPMCVDCSTKMTNDANMREQAYAADVKQWSSEGLRIRKGDVTRKPIRVKQVAPTIVEG